MSFDQCGGGRPRLALWKGPSCGVLWFNQFLLLFCFGNISDCMLFIFPELKLCGFRWFSASLAAEVDGIKPILWQAFHIGLMVSSVTLAKTSSAFWIAGPLVKVTEHLSACLSASSWQGEMQLALCNNWYIWKAGREEEWKSALNLFFSQLGRRRSWKMLVLLSIWLMIAAKDKHAISQCQSFDCS